MGRRGAVDVDHGARPGEGPFGCDVQQHVGVAGGGHVVIVTGHDRGGLDREAVGSHCGPDVPAERAVLG